MQTSLLIYIAAHLTLYVLAKSVLKIDHSMVRKDYDFLLRRYHNGDVEAARNLPKPRPFRTIPIASRVFKVECPDRTLWVKCTGIRRRSLTVLETNRTKKPMISVPIAGRPVMPLDVVHGTN